MFVTEINLWGAALIALVIIDRKMSRRMLLVYGVTLVQMILLGIVLIGGCVLLILPISVFMTVHAVLVASLTASLTQTMLTAGHSRIRRRSSPRSSVFCRRSVPWFLPW